MAKNGSEDGAGRGRAGELQGLRLEGRAVLLTGASGGLGKAMARALHARGARLVITGRRVEELESLRSELGESLRVVAADLARRRDVDRLIEETGQVDVLVANAALPGSGRLDSFRPGEIDRALDVNLRAPIQLARAFVPEMVEQGAGHVVLISSMNGKVPAGGASVYCATKFGLRGFGLALREELHGSGVGVTTVFPGFVSDAGMWADTGLRLPQGIGTSSPEQVAAAVVSGIEANRAEVDVAPLPVRASALVAAVAPSAVLAATRRLGSHALSADLAEAQRVKR